MASSGNDNVLFDKSHADEDIEDVWDDTALIKAYDRAVSKMKRQITKQINSNTTEETDYTDTDRSKKSSSHHHHKKEKKKQKHSRKQIR